jgi:hypothetical protein
VGFAWGYDEVRALHGDVAHTGVTHAQDVLRIDRALHVEWVTPVNHWLAGHTSIAEALSGYYFVMHLGMTSLTLVVLWLHGRGYRWHRDALVLMSLVGLAVYWLYPVAPPRLLPGFHDTVRQLLPTAYHLETARANLYAAVPSLHIAWAVWCGLVLWSISRRTWVRTIAVLHPVLTTVTVVATGNHYVFDVVTGAALIGVSYPLLRGLVPVAERLAPRRVLVGVDGRGISDLDQRRIPQQQPLAADVATEVDLGLGALGSAAHRDYPAESERVVGDSVAWRQGRDRP